MAVTTDLSGRVAIITGSGRGIGRVIAYRLAEAGADVVTAARSEDEIKAVSREVESEFGVKSLSIPTNLRDSSDIESLVDETVREMREPDILVNNAGVNFANRAIHQTTDEVDAMIDINFRSPFLLSQKFAKTFRESNIEKGCIVNVSSVSALIGKDFTSLYGGTKAGLHGLTRGLAAGFSAYGIRVNSVVPSTTKVERVEELIEERGDELYNIDKIPLERLGEPIDIADLVLFLVSDHADYITGVNIPVDGGVSFTAGLYSHR